MKAFDELQRQLSQLRRDLQGVLYTLQDAAMAETGEAVEAFIVSPDVYFLLGEPTITGGARVVVDVAETGYIRALVSRRCSAEPRRYEWRTQSKLDAVPRGKVTG